MIKKLMTVAALAMLALPAATTQVQAQDASWIHVHMEGVDDDATARLNLPASMISVVLEMVREEGFDGAGIDGPNGDDIDIERLRRMWAAVRDAGDAEFMDMESDEGRMRIYREGDRFHVDGEGEDGETVRVEMPVEIADILLGTGDDIDVQAAIAELARRGDPDLIQMTGPDGSVRVWVDNRPGQDN